MGVKVLVCLQLHVLLCSGVYAGLLDTLFVVMKGWCWLMSATCVPWYVPRCNTSLSKHGDPVFPHFCPLHQNVAHVKTREAGDT